MVLCVPKLQKKRVLEKSKEKKMSLKDKFKKASKEVKERVEYIRGDKGILEQKYQETKKISPEDKLGEFRRIAVLGGIDLAWFLFCLGKQLTYSTVLVSQTPNLCPRLPFPFHNYEFAFKVCEPVFLP